MTRDDARLLASARVVLTAAAREYGHDYDAGYIAARALAAADAIHSAMLGFSIYGKDIHARRFADATDQEHIDSL